MAGAELNREVRWQEGTNGEIVILGAWCENCGEESPPHERTGACLLCGRQIVDLDQLSAKELRAAANGGRPETVPDTASVVPIRAELELPPRPQLAIAEGFALPLDIAGEATAILAKRGAGKTNTGRVLAEEYHGAGVQLAIVDPVGVWWGLRSHADGEHDGLPIPLLGGEHGDVGLSPWAGKIVAQVLVETGTSLILDLSDFAKEEQHEFVADFAETLYALKRRQRSLMHVMLEEADEFAPQRSRGSGNPEEVARMRKAVEALARRGRSSGIGLTLITQRSAALSKDALTQADTLITMRTTGPADVKAIQEWVASNADGRDSVVRSLAGLKTGEGWVWSPEREVLARVQIRLAWTFDSSSTPKFGEERVEPRRRSAVTLPLELDRMEQQPEPDLADDYRLVDEDGHYGCKIDGCPERSKSKAGPLAFLCTQHGGPPLEEADEPVGTVRLNRTYESVQELVEPPVGRHDETGKPALPIRADGVNLFGVTGFFDRDAERVRGEAERLRAQADELDKIAESLDALHEMGGAT